MCVGNSYYEPRTTAADGELVRFDGEEVTTPAVIDAIIDSLAELA
jgi:hypothetical protein